MNRGSSTFAVARQIIDWATDIEPTLCIQEDDILPLCVGPIRKVLNFSKSNFRNQIDVTSAATNVVASNESLKAAERDRKNNERRSIRLEIRQSLETEIETRIDLLNAINELQFAEARNDRALRDRDALITGWKIHEEICLQRNNEIHTWTRLLDVCRELSKIERSVSTIESLRNRSADALTSLKTDNADQHSTLKLENVQPTDRYSASFGRTMNQQTNAELHRAIIADYAAAVRVSHMAAEKYKDRIIFDVEDDVFFRNALALELASAEKSSLKRCISEVECALSELSSALPELQNQRNSLESLKARSADLKKSIAHQAGINISLDRKLNGLCSHHFGLDGAEDPSFCGSDELSRIKALSSSTLPNLDEVILTSLGDRFDGSVHALASSLTALSGCWTEQTAALTESPLPTLLRIVPSSSSVKYDNSNCSTGREQYLPRGRFSLPDYLDCAAGTAFELPMPHEDFTSYQASNPATTFRTLASRLDVPTSLSARSSLRTVGLLRANQRGSNPISSSSSSLSSGRASIMQTAGQLLSSVTSLYSSVGCTSFLSRGPASSAASDQERGVEDIVTNLNRTADRILECTSSAESLRVSIISLAAEEKAAEAALDDFSRQFADPS